MSNHQLKAGKPVPFGPFVLERRIAVGGSAEVFLAHPKLGSKPAARLIIKRLLPSSRAEESLGQLEREAELHRAAIHPNVVKVYGAGMVGEEPYLAMEYVDGVDLYRLLRRAESEQRPMPASLAMYIARRVALALHAVHAARDSHDDPLFIVHRDVTPSNIYLSTSGEIKLGDFGIARGQIEANLNTMGLKGKFGYLAPEQVAGEPFDHKADLFALMAVLGEMLIGERVFPGSGQLAVLLAIRDANIEPLRRESARLPEGLLQVFEKALAQDPSARYQSAGDLSDALEPFETGSAEELEAEVSHWVLWARDSSHLARQLEGRVRDSVQRMRAVRRLTPSAAGPRSEIPTVAPGSVARSKIRRAGSTALEEVEFSELIEMIATGELSSEDQVALFGTSLETIGNIDDLARHLLPSTTQATGRLLEPGVPDYQYMLEETHMVRVLAQMRQNGETGGLFVLEDRATGSKKRKEIYLVGGRLHHVASSERGELLGEYLVRKGRLTREQLTMALSTLAANRGRLGDTLIGLGFVQAVDVFRAIRDQGRDRVASLCPWEVGTASFYRGTTPGHVEFPLDLDLASPMMAGVLARAKKDPSSLPQKAARLSPGPRRPAFASAKERGTAPISMLVLPKMSDQKMSVSEVVDFLTRPPSQSGQRQVQASEAMAALVAAQALGWIGIS